MSRWPVRGAFLFTLSLLTPSTAQPKPEAGRSFYEIGFQWNYSRASRRGCAFTCPGGGGASHEIN